MEDQFNRVKAHSVMLRYIYTLLLSVVKLIQGKGLLLNTWGDRKQPSKRLRTCRLRVSSVRSYFLPSVTLPSTRKPQELLQFPSNTFTKQNIVLYLVELNNFELLSRGLPKLFQMPGFNLSPSIFHNLLPDCHLPSLKEDSTLRNPEKKAPTVAWE